jgi:hypothetical protein
MSKRTPEEILKAIEESEVDDEVDRILAMSPEERRRSLEAAGVDISKLHGQADALHDRIQQTSGGQEHTLARGEERKRADGGGEKATHGGGGNGAQVVKLPGPRRRLPRARWLALPAAAALAWGAVALTTGVAIVGQPSPENPEAATTLREKARAECAESKWKACLDDLNAAKKLDPHGEDEAIQRERVAAENALRGAP